MGFLGQIEFLVPYYKRQKSVLCTLVAVDAGLDMYCVAHHNTIPIFIGNQSMNKSLNPGHPGHYVREHVLPKGMLVTKAAKCMGNRSTGTFEFPQWTCYIVK